jgi:hypothetical protein
MDRLIWLGQVLLSVAFVINYNRFTVFLLFLNSILLVGSSVSRSHSVAGALKWSLFGIGQSWQQASKQINTIGSLPSAFRVRTVLIPVGFLILFIGLYRMGSTGFNRLTDDMIHSLGDYLAQFNGVEFLVVLIFGFVLSSVVFLKRVRFEPTPANTLPAENTMEVHKANKLAIEGSITFSLLIGLIGAVLYYEITEIWLGFEWKHQLLKPLVHSGTYVLLVSTAISLFTTLFYFRKRYPAAKGTRVFKTLSVIWSILNMILLASLLYRTGLYIRYFGLAYLRIGVIYFVIASAFGLGTVIVSVISNRSAFYLVRTNSLFLYMLLISTSFFSWDQLIPSYNLAHADRSFVDLTFFEKLSNKSLPYIDLSHEELDSLNALQRSHLLFVDSAYHEIIQYEGTIDAKKRQFNEEYTDRHWKEWNYPDWKAYHHINQK